LGRYSDTEQVGTVILWNKSFLEHKSAPRALEENLYNLQRILPRLEMILLAVDGDWETFIEERGTFELDLEFEIEDSRTAHQLEFLERKSPDAFAIREVEVRHMNWSLEEEDYLYDAASDDVDESEKNLRFSIWEKAVKSHLSEFSAEDHGACFRDFNSLSWLEQYKHLLEYRGLGDNEQRQYVRKFYGLVDESVAQSRAYIPE
jgi:hypothetical protein